MSYKKEFNKYVIIDNIVKMEIFNEENDIVYAIFDLDDLEKVKSLNLHWNCFHRKDNLDYVRATKYLGIQNGKPNYKIIFLHNVILNRIDEITTKIHGDHINNDCLDNRKSNLRIINVENNSKNRKTKNINNTTGYRNVTKVKDKYIVQLQINNENKKLGEFKDVDIAGKYAEEMRRLYYGKYAGNN